MNSSGRMQSANRNSDTKNFNAELLHCIEELKLKRDDLQRAITEEEEERTRTQREIRSLSERLQQIDDSLTRKSHARNEYEKTIQETEAAYAKIVESSQTLLSVLRRESDALKGRRAEPA